MYNLHILKDVFLRETPLNLIYNLLIREHKHSVDALRLRMENFADALLVRLNILK